MNRVRKREPAPRTPNAAAQWPRAWDFAKRLECVRLAGAFETLAHDAARVPTPTSRHHPTLRTCLAEGL